MSSKIQEFIRYGRRRRLVKIVEVVGETLPVGLRVNGLVVCGIGPVQKAEFDFGLIYSTRHSRLALATMLTQVQVQGMTGGLDGNIRSLEDWR